MQRTRRQEIEIGNESSETGDVLDPADQSLMCGVILINHRGAMLRTVVDNDVHLVAAEPGPGDGFFKGGRARHALVRLRRRQKIVGILFDVVLDGIEIRRDLGEIAITGPQLVHHQCDRGPGRFAVERAHGLAMLALRLRHLLHDRFELALNLLQVVLNPVALGLGQGLEHLRRQHLALAPRRQGQAHRRSQHGDAL